MNPRLFAEELGIAVAFVPTDLASGAITGKGVNMKHYDHLVILVVKAAGSASEPATLTVEQGTDSTFTTAKALNFTRADVRRSADITTTGTMTKVTQTAANTLAMDGTTGATQVLAMVEFNDEDLDTENGYTWARGKYADVGTTAQLATLIYLLPGARYTPPPSPLV
jgi:hypothetical protein